MALACVSALSYQVLAWSGHGNAAKFNSCFWAGLDESTCSNAAAFLLGYPFDAISLFSLSEELNEVFTSTNETVLKGTHWPSGTSPADPHMGSGKLLEQPGQSVF